MLILSSNLSLALPNGYFLEDFRQNISDGFFISSCVLHHSFILSRKHKCKDEGTLYYAQRGNVGKPYSTAHSQPEIFALLGFYAAYIGS